MKNSFEKEFNQMMNEKKEIPIKVRHSLDQSYDIIRAKSKKKKANLIWNRVAAAACSLIVTGVVLTNEHVMAGINQFFNFGDEGVEQAVNNGFTQENNSTATDQNINITLERHFLDANKIGMSFQLVFKDPTVLNNVEEISMDYRLKNGDGEYIEEFIPDTKPLKGNNQYMSVLEYHNPILDTKTGKVQFDVLMESHKGIIPTLKDAVIEVESINLFYGSERKIKKMDGKWELSVANLNNTKENLTIEYVMYDQQSILKVSTATANPTSLNLTFSLDGTYEDENNFAHRMKIIDENGNEYYSDSGFSRDIKNNDDYFNELSNNIL
ncbi:DUF4179 domain-containing protein [Bacillus sp. JJ722]|uniref:DUF4179 domain-containing protein n=1 Tax=Bacillus sp. JJ722 TaxID=3122973 RepID=UPI002FFDCC4D